jgi:two-component system, cell cycle sensor histidine kinase and response regulator CckA
LIVEDEGIVALELASRVAEMGYEVAGIASSGEAAVAIAATSRIRLALIDVRLSGESSGTDVAKRLRAEFGIPAVFITAYSDAETLRRIKECEPLGYLLKPFDERTLWVTIETALHTHELAVQRAEAERARRRSDALYVAILDHSYDGIISIDAGQHVTVFNKGAEAIFGYRAEEVLGRPLDVLLPDEGAARHREHIARFIESSITSRSMGSSLEVVGRRKNGDTFAAEVSISKLDHEGEVVLTAFVRDATERRALEQEVNRARRLDALGRLAGGIAHDFNNLLTAVLGYARILRKALPSEHVLQQDVSGILLAGERAATLVRQLLSYGRGAELRLSPLDLNQTVTRLETMIRPILGERVHLRIETEPDLRPIAADPIKMDQLVMNLVLNARDAMPDGGVVTVTTRSLSFGEFMPKEGGSTGDFVVLIVSDTGLGMDEQVRARLFEPFFTTKTPGSGTGLGLFTVYGIVRQAGGHIEVESRPARGATFRVYLPVASDRAYPVPRSLSPAAAGASVLLVDDEPAVRELVARWLREHGYDVQEAANAEAALAVAGARGEPIDLLLTDLVMPGKSGIDLAHELVSARRVRRVLIMSAYIDDLLHDVPFVRKRFQILEKPLDPEILLLAVARALSQEPDPQLAP